ncbi:MAG: hypothetical protein H0V29_01570 [Thermoleophilaceae bacterium]|nr:hypothetical protein [Thermoleophilaceae bacterium]
MIYCVVPQALAPDLFDNLVEYYKDDANVKVIVDRRGGPDRRKRGEDGEHQHERITRDRRRRRASGSFPPVDPPG